MNSGSLLSMNDVIPSMESFVEAHNAWAYASYSNRSSRFDSKDLLRILFVTPKEMGAPVANLSVHSIVVSSSSS